MNLNTTHDPTSAKCAFISHSSHDDLYVAEFVQLVRSLGFDDVFNDSHTIEPDAKLWERIEQGILECDAFVVILSQASVKSHWVSREVEFARLNGKRVIPIRIDDCSLPSSFDGRDVIELKLSGKSQRISPPRFLHHAAELFLGRESELAMLDTAWAAGINVLSLIAWGGVGKTSLMAQWVQTRFIDQQWKDAEGRPNPLAYFDWSFYDQGTRSLEDGSSARTGNVGEFFEQALKFFGDPNPSAPGKGSRLAEWVRQQRTLFILDGLEPLQQPVGHAQAGRLIEPDLREFLVSLAALNPGLCVITSRQAVTDLRGLRGRASETRDLEDLPKSVAVRLLRKMQVAGSDKELEEASEKFGCHALSLTLLGRFLVDAHGGDIRRIDRVKDLHRADDLTREDRHRTAKKVLAAYDEWLATAQADGNPRTLAVLRLTGLFDRAATPDCLSVLRAEPVIPGLTDAICGMADDEWNTLLKRLDRFHLIKLRESSAGQFGIDAHPLVREYFAHKLKQTEPQAWQAAHERLYRHLCATPPDKPNATLEDLQPLFQAVAHGCQAGLQQEVREKVYRDRILGKSPFRIHSLGGFSMDLETIACFFVTPWRDVYPLFAQTDQAWLLHMASFDLISLGRLNEAIEPARTSLQRFEKLEDWKFACILSNQLGELLLLLGDIDGAMRNTEQAIKYVQRCIFDFERLELTRYYHAHVLHYAGRAKEAECQFGFCQLKSVQGYDHCDLLLDTYERTAWYPHNSGHGLSGEIPIYNDLIKRARQIIKFGEADEVLFEMALGHLVLGRAALYAAVISTDSVVLVSFLLPTSHLQQSVSGLRRAGDLTYLPCALLTRAWLRSLTSAWTGPESAQSDLDEAWEIAERGPMPLFMADIHLYRARLFGSLKSEAGSLKYPWTSVEHDLKEARRLIEKHGYWRRKEELEDAEAALLNGGGR